MPAIRDANEIAQKWASVTPQRAGEYEKGVSSPKNDWAQAAVAAKDAWSAGVQAAIQANSFSRGVSKAGTAKWQAKSISKGVQRFGPGVQEAQADYATAMGPVVEVIRRTTLPPRFARRDPRNLERVRVMAAALSALKTGRTTA